MLCLALSVNFEFCHCTIIFGFFLYTKDVHVYCLCLRMTRVYMRKCGIVPTFSVLSHSEQNAACHTKIFTSVTLYWYQIKNPLSNSSCWTLDNLVKLCQLYKYMDPTSNPKSLSPHLGPRSRRCLYGEEEGLICYRVMLSTRTVINIFPNSEREKLIYGTVGHYVSETKLI